MSCVLEPHLDFGYYPIHHGHSLLFVRVLERDLSHAGAVNRRYTVAENKPVLASVTITSKNCAPEDSGQTLGFDVETG